MDFLTVQTQAGYASLTSHRTFSAGQIIAELPCTGSFTAPTRYTIQADVDRHIEVGIFTSLNHSCNPNVLIDTANMRVIAAQDIPVGAELTYFYPSSEWEMATPFVCHCGSPACVQVVAGAKHLSVAVLGRYFVNQHIQTLVNDWLTKTRSGTLQQA
jgi:hypothetical protein